MVNNKTYTIKDFGDALKELIQIQELTYGQLAVKIGSSATYINDLTKRKLLPPRDEKIKLFAKALGIKPEYFYEYRLRRLIDYFRSDKEFLDYCLSLIEGRKKKISNCSAKTKEAIAG